LEKNEKQGKGRKCQLPHQSSTAVQLQQFSMPKNSAVQVEIKFVCQLTFLQQEVIQAECVFRKSIALPPIRELLQL